LEDTGIDGRMLLKMDPKEIDWEGMEWIIMAQERNKWRAVVKVVMNPWVA
jgi:hypothetical protein